MCTKYPDERSDEYSAGNKWVLFGCFIHSASAERLLCVDQDKMTLVLFDGKGGITHKLKGHMDHINKISPIPNTNYVIAAGVRGSHLFYIPTSSEQKQIHEDGKKELVRA